jgi:class 3 adenylate cyclase
MIFDLQKFTISRLTLFFKDRKLNQEYIESYQVDYLRTVRLVTIIMNIFTLFIGVFYCIYSVADFKYHIVFTNLFVGIIFYILTYFQYIRKNISKYIFFLHLLIGFWTVEISHGYEVSTLIILQIIISLSIFPRNYFLFSVIGNSVLILYYLFDKTEFINFNLNIFSEFFLLLGSTFYLELSAYMKEITNKKDFLNSKKIKEQEEKANLLLENILPKEIANELKQKGYVDPREFPDATILFTDFKNFTQITESLLPSELLKELDGYFFQFDEIVKRYNIEKLKTIGDSYMCVGGIPKKNTTHPIDAALTGFEMQKIMNQMKQIKISMSLPFWELRIGIHTGEVIGGVIGKSKFAFDIWGDTVNLASRMETGGEVGKVNISEITYQRVKDFFDCEYRGEIEVKNKGKVKMYFLTQIHPELSLDGKGQVPNEKFNLLYQNL